MNWVRWFQVYHLFVLIVVGMLGSCVSTPTPTANLPYAPLQVTATATLDGHLISHKWMIPGAPGPMTHPILGSVVFHLENSEDLWININGVYGPIYLKNEPGTNVTRKTQSFYFIDKAEIPEILTDYSTIFQNDYCKKGFRILNCSVTISVSRLADEPPTISEDVGGGDGVDFGHPDTLANSIRKSTAPAVFVSLLGERYKLPSTAYNDPIVGPKLSRLTKLDTLTLNATELNRIRSLTNTPDLQNLWLSFRYIGDGTCIPPNEDAIGLPVGREAGILYRSNLRQEDVPCFWLPEGPLTEKIGSSVAGSIAWRGEVVNISPYSVLSRKPLVWTSMFDPSDRTLFVLNGPQAKPVWAVPAKSQLK